MSAGGRPEPRRAAAPSLETRPVTGAPPAAAAGPAPAPAPPRPGPSYAQGFVLAGEATTVRRLVADVWRSRELIRTLARKDFFVAYRRAAFGLVWSVAVPALQATVMSLILSRFIRFSEISHFPIYVFSGVVAWSFFSAALSNGTTSIVDGSDLATKIYFPRAVLPLVSVATQCYSLVPTLLVLVAATLVVAGLPGPQILLLLPAVALLAAITVAFTLVLSALYVYFRDTRFIVSASLIAWFYATPIFYPIGRTGALEPLVQANPLTGVAMLFHEATVGAGDSLGVPLAWTAGWTVGLAALGLWLHRRYDRVFIDLL